MAVLVTALVVELTGGPTTAATPRAEVVRQAAPVFHSSGFADPTVARYAHGYVAVSTGARAPRAVARTPRGPWKPAGRALAVRPAWAKPAAIWAPDLVWTGKRWLLYFSAVKRGGAKRCIGVATARRATDAFRPGRSPLVCPRRGAIDPSGYTARSGGRHLVYKTQGLPTTIRVVRLSRDGRHRAHGAAGRVLLRSRHTVVENPTLVRRGRLLFLLTSEGSFEDCGYRTTWRRSRTLHHWSRPRLLLGNHGLCGPGGADLSVSRRGRVVFFHGWTCHRAKPCPARFHSGRDGHPHARRALYAAHLDWRHATPRIGRFVRPIRW
ncbi:family 43 glycosylhydrolase [Nocardioides pyridinolyticus]